MYTLTVKPATGKPSKISAKLICVLQKRLAAHINANCYGARDIGAEYAVTRNGVRVGTMFYNTRYETVNQRTV